MAERVGCARSDRPGGELPTRKDDPKRAFLFGRDTEGRLKPSLKDDEGPDARLGPEAFAGGRLGFAGDR